MSMNPEHLDAYISGELRDESALFIEGSIRRDETLQDEVYLQAQMDQALRWMFAAETKADLDAGDGELPAEEQAAADAANAAGILQMDDFVAGVMASVSAGDERTLARSVLTELLEEQGKSSRPHPWWDLAKAAAVAAIAVIATVLALQSVEVRDDVAAAQREAVEDARVLARVTREQDAVWGKTSTVQRDGDWLSSGLLHLESGLAEVTFDNGAQAIIEGPCYLDIETPQRAFLRRGRITVEVPPPAVGFIVNTPSMNVVDLGTRFGIDVAASGTSEVHVMEGVVEATRSEGRAVPLLLREGLAVRADQRTRSRLMPIEYAGDSFELRAGDEVLPPPPTVFYRFDEGVGAVLEDSGAGFEGGPFEASLVPTEFDEVTGFSSTTKNTPRRSAGRIGRGLVFHHGESLSASMPVALGIHRPHTMACWIKLSPKGWQAGSDEGATILSLSAAPVEQEVGGEGGLLADSPANPGWRLSCNAEGGDGPSGALRIDFGQGFVIGTTDLRDGRWHHVASRFAGAESGDGSDVATHVRLFVDGELEATGAFRRQHVPNADSDVDAADNHMEPLFLGIGTDSTFEGSIDEVVISGGPLSPTAIYQMARQPERRATSF